MSRERFINNGLAELEENNRNPMYGYQHLPVLTLEETMQDIIPLVPDVTKYVLLAKRDCNQDPTRITLNESAAIHLYTMSTSFFSCLNKALRTENRDALKPWLSFLKLFITGLEKLPSINDRVWRGVGENVSGIFKEKEVHIWCSVNSCSKALNVIEMYLGQKGTVFAIDTMYGKDIANYSAFPLEHEVILMPGARVRAKCKSLSFIDRFFLVSLEEVASQRETQTETSDLIRFIKQAYKRHGFITRIVNTEKSFPIEQSYINLAIVEARELVEQEKKLLDAKLCNEIIGTYEEIYGTKTKIEVENIFTKCKNETKKILILGRAGIGKTTFCQYVTYRWAIGTLWSHYTLIVLIPLRHITEETYPARSANYCLIDFVKKEYFGGHAISKHDEKAFEKQCNKGQVLWLLDGYDEFILRIPLYLKHLFVYILDTQHHILTSRPYRQNLSYNVQMEITGFSNQNIIEYVKLFFDPISNKIDNEPFQDQELLKFLKVNPTIWGIAHIPVNLELICSLWSNMNMSVSVMLTTTALYDKIIEWLCRRYLEKQNLDVQMTKKHIYLHCRLELAFLERIAFDATRNNTLMILPEALENALQCIEYPLSDQPQFLNKVLNMGILKSFDHRATGTHIEADKDHYFVHYSFQEHFAARYLSAQFNSAAFQEATEFIKTHKYDQRFQLILAFTSGLVTSNGSVKSIQTFWDALLGEPLDLVGIRHIQMVITCLEEITDKSRFSQFEVLMNYIKEWIECSLWKKHDYLWDHLKIALKRSSLVNQSIIINTLVEVLKGHDSTTQNNTCLFISQIPILNPPVSLIDPLLHILARGSQQLRVSACKALRNICKTTVSEKVIKQLITASYDIYADVQWYASQTLIEISKTNSNKIIEQLLSTFQNPSDHIRLIVLRTIDKMAEVVLNDEVICMLVGALNDQDSRVSINACKILIDFAAYRAEKIINHLVLALGNKNAEVIADIHTFLVKNTNSTIGNIVKTQLVEALHHQNPTVRLSACEVLGKMQGDVANNKMIEALLIALGDPSSKVKLSACNALDNIMKAAPKIEVINGLLLALEDLNDEVKIKVCQILGNIQRSTLVDKIRNGLMLLLDSPSSIVKSSAYYALSRIDGAASSEKFVDTLIIMLGNLNNDVKCNARKALVQLGRMSHTKKIFYQLTMILQDQNSEIRKEIYDILIDLSQEENPSDLIDVFINELRNRDPKIKLSVCKRLGNIIERTSSTEAINALLIATEDSDNEVRMEACRSFGMMKRRAITVEIIDRIIVLLEDRCVKVRSSACQTLHYWKLTTEISNGKVIEKIFIMIVDVDKYLRFTAQAFLRQFGGMTDPKKIFYQLTTILQDQNSEIRKEIYDILIDLSQKESLSDLIDVFINELRNNDPKIKLSACKSLGNIIERTSSTEAINALIVAIINQNNKEELTNCKGVAEMHENDEINNILDALFVAFPSRYPEAESKGNKAIYKIFTMIGEDIIINALLNAFADKFDEERTYTVETLGKIIDGLVYVLKKEDCKVKANACRVLGLLMKKLSNSDVIDALMISSLDRIDEVRQNARTALRDICIKTPSKIVTDRLINALSDEDYEVVKSACKFITGIAKTEASNEAVSILLGARWDSSTNENLCIRMLGQVLPFFLSRVQYDQLAVSLFCFCMIRFGPGVIENITSNKIFKIFLLRKDISWAKAAAMVSFTNGSAVVVKDNSIVLYENEDSIDFRVSDETLHRQFVDAFVERIERLRS